MMEARWTAWRVIRQAIHSYLTVRRCWDQWTEETSFTDQPSPGRPRQTSVREDHHIIRHAMLDAGRGWTATEWNQVIFSDESKSNLISADNSVRVGMPCGERLNPAFALQRHTASKASVMV
ncbi:transposable element Tcb2 transposase [Trichonephila clavipes]|nr:transposable element Tcb2 transposase [Trichonephila clavipes]